MTIKRGNKGLFPYLGDYSPVNIYKGETKLSGWKWQSQSGEVLKFENGYKDVVHVGVDGKSVQDGVPLPDHPIAINSLDKSFDIVSSKSSPSSSATKDIQYDTQTPTLYKTNILLSEALRSVGDVKDRVFLDTDGLWKVERNVGEFIATGNEGWTPLGVNGRYDISVGLEDSGAINNLISTHYQYLGINKDLSIWTSAKGLRIQDFRFKTADELKTFLKSEVVAGRPLTVLHQLATPTIETLSAEQQTKLNNIQSFKGSNYVYTIANVVPNLNGKMKVKEI